MWRPATMLILCCALGLCSPVAKATIVDIFCHGAAFPLPDNTWDFDYELQELSLYEWLHDVGRGSLQDQLPRIVEARGRMDSQTSTVTIVKKVANVSGVPWTEYVWELRSLIVGGADIVVDSAWSNKLTTISYSGREIVFSGDDPVLDEEILTVRADFQFVGYGSEEPPGFSVSMDGYAVPEPASVLLLAFGALVLRKPRRPCANDAMDYSTGR